MEHRAKNGRPKILKECTLPLTGRHCVDRIITDMCVFDVDHTASATSSRLVLKELAPGQTVEDVRQATGCDFRVAESLTDWKLDE